MKKDCCGGARQARSRSPASRLLSTGALQSLISLLIRLSLKLTTLSFKLDLNAPSLGARGFLELA